MGTLATELAAHADRLSAQPRVYVDANVPAGLVVYMRAGLHWDVFSVIEHDDLRRASDTEHYRLARQLRRTLITLDRDYLDDRRFPPGESGGVLVLMAPGERGFMELLRRLDTDVFHVADAAATTPGLPASDVAPLPLEGRKLHLHIDWPGVSIDGRLP